MKQEEFINNVKQVLNEVSEENPSFQIVGLDTMMLAHHIKTIYNDAWHTLFNLRDESGHYAVSRNYFTILSFKDSRIEHDYAHGNGYVVLPKDFYSLYSFAINGWHNPITNAVSFDDIIYKRQTNKHIRGSFIRPIGAIGYIAKESDKVLEYFSIKKGLTASISEAFYIPKPNGISDVENIKQELLRPMSYTIASLIYSLQNKQDIAQVLMQRAISQLII